MGNRIAKAKESIEKAEVQCANRLLKKMMNTPEGQMKAEMQKQLKAMNTMVAKKVLDEMIRGAVGKCCVTLPVAHQFNAQSDDKRGNVGSHPPHQSSSPK